MWLYIPSTCLRSAPATEASASPLTWHWEALARSATLRGKHSLPRRWQGAWRKAPWMRHLSGLTCSPSTAGRGVESWVESLRASPASPIPRPGSDWGMPTSEPSGRTSAGSLRKSSLSSSSLRTSQGSLPFSSRSRSDWSGWVTESKRLSSSVRTMLARATSASASSSWHTPDATGAAVNWPTPTVCGNDNRKGASTTSGDGLQTAVKIWPTPCASDGKRGDRTEHCAQDPRAGMDLMTAAMNFQRPTPVTGGDRGPTETSPEMWATPTARDGKDGTAAFAEVDTNSLLGREAPRWAFSHGDLVTDGGRIHPPQSIRLNPRFAEWLMGLPLGWTDAELSAMEWCHWQRLFRSEYSRLVRVLSNSDLVSAVRREGAA